MTNVRGVLPPIPTYLTADNSIDEAWQRRAVAHVLEGGADGVVVLGTAGEGPVLPLSARALAIDVAVESAGQNPVVVGCAPHSVIGALTQLRDAFDRGAAAALMLPPHYYRLGQRAIVGLFEAVAHDSPIDIALYHIPSLTGNGFDVATVERLAEHPRIVGIKDSDRDFAYHLELRRKVAGSGFRVFQGAAPLLLASVIAGSEDSICPVTALVPDWERDLRKAIACGDQSAAAAAGDRIARMAELFNLGDVPMPVNFKAIAQLLGLGPDRPHEPVLALSEAHRRQIGEKLSRMGLDVATPVVGAPA